MIDSQLAQVLFSIGTLITQIEQMNAGKCLSLARIYLCQLTSMPRMNNPRQLRTHSVSADIYTCFYLYCHYNGTDEYPRQLHN